MIVLLFYCIVGSMCRCFIVSHCRITVLYHSSSKNDVEFFRCHQRKSGAHLIQIRRLQQSVMLQLEFSWNGRVCLDEILLPATLVEHPLESLLLLLSSVTIHLVHCFPSTPPNSSPLSPSKTCAQEPTMWNPGHCSSASAWVRSPEGGNPRHGPIFEGISMRRSSVIGVARCPCRTWE